MDKHIQRAVDFALSHFVQTERIREGRERKIRASMQIPPEYVRGLFAFLLSHAQSAEDLLPFLQNRQQAALQAAAERKRNGSIRWVLVIFALFALCALISGADAILDTRQYLLVFIFVPIVAFIGLMIWQPRMRAMEAVWRAPLPPDGDLTPRMEELVEISGTPLWRLLTTRARAAGIVCVLLPALLFAGVAGIAANEQRVEDNYHAAMIADGDLMVSSGSRGTRYAVYDVDEQRYVRDYLDPSMLAQTPDDVRAVLLVDMEKLKVGTYGGDSSAWQYYAHISLYDCVHGERYPRTELAIGSEPPSTVYSQRFSSTPDGHGDKPTDADIRAACERLIDEMNASDAAQLTA